MPRVAAFFSQMPSMKQAQLKIAAGAGPHGEEIGEQLFQLKQKDHFAEKLKCTWAYFPGFFDAEGSVTVTPLSVGQARSKANQSICPQEFVGAPA